MLQLNLPFSITENWDIDENNILDSTHKQTYEPLFKFAYHMPTNEFLIMARPKGNEGHTEMIKEHSTNIKNKFHEYVRGIWLKQKNIVYLRFNYNEDYLKATEKMLRENGVPETVRIIWGDAAENELAKDPDLH